MATVKTAEENITACIIWNNAGNIRSQSAPGVPVKIGSLTAWKKKKEKYKFLWTLTGKRAIIVTIQDGETRKDG